MTLDMIFFYLIISFQVFIFMIELVMISEGSESNHNP